MANRLAKASPFIITTIIFLAIAVFSFIGVRYYVEQTVHLQLRDTMDIALAAVNPDRVMRQKETSTDSATPDYTRLKEQLLKIGKTFKKNGIDSIYIMAQNGNKIVFIADSMQLDNPRYSAPGVVYENPPPKVEMSATKGTQEIDGPYTDEYGTFISHFAPIKTFSDNKTVGIMGVDMDYNYLQRRIISAQIYILSIIIFIYIITLLAVLYFQNKNLAKEELAASEEKYKLIYQASKDGLITLESPNWDFLNPNPAAISMFKAKNGKDLEGTPWRWSPEKQPDGQLSKEKAKKMIETAISKGVHLFEWMHKDANNKEFPAEVMLTKFTIGDRVILQASVRDISERKKREQELGEKQKDLEDLNDVMTGREIKMTELKAKIRDLEQELEKYKK